MAKSDIKAMLLHLGYNMWSKCDSELRLKDEYWRKATDCMAAAKRRPPGSFWPPFSVCSRLISSTTTWCILR
ncbi:MAG: hypothetical protein II326_04020 [Clostridia bacterium]|nr:hypothetical protein [Clostridia bacterium]